VSTPCAPRRRGRPAPPAPTVRALCLLACLHADLCLPFAPGRKRRRLDEAALAAAREPGSDDDADA
jgi:hypothetical protein